MCNYRHKRRTAFKMSDNEDLNEDETRDDYNESDSENSEDGGDFADDDNEDNDDNEEVFGDDENLSEEDDNVDDNEEEEEEDAMEEEINENINEQNPIPIDVDQNEENVQDTVFIGINALGMRVPLESTENLRAIDHLLVTLARSIRHNSTYEHLIDDQEWIKKSFRFINMPTTKKALWRVLGRTRENLIYRFFCEQCKQQIGVGRIRLRCRCGRCGPGQDKSFVATYIQIRLRPQLGDLFKISYILESLRYKYNRIKINPDAIKDIYDGDMYKELSEPGNFLSNPHNYSLTLWTDRLKLTKSSRATTYPIVFQVNKLSPHARKKHLLLAGIWVAKEHPIMNAIIGPVRDELIDVYINGIPWRPNGADEVISRFIVIIFTADSVARPDVLRMKKFNGVNGCVMCLALGQREINTWIYPALPFEAAIEARRTINGVKGVSALTTLPEFNMRDGVVVDGAHNIYLGVAKRLVERYLNDAEEAWYLGRPQQTAAIDQRLLTIKTPTRISRQPRSILLYKMWKASEWRNCLLYYALPCLDGILVQSYYSHLAMLCQAGYILNSASITQANLNTAERLIEQFIHDYQRHYALVNMVYNVHLLRHLVRSVRNWGPLWVYSALPFESLNKKITDYITSPYGRPDQIVTRFFIKKFITVTARLVPLSEEAREEVGRLLKIEGELVQGMPEGHYFFGMGRQLIRYPREEEINLLRLAGHVINPETEITLFRRAVIHGAEYRVQDNIRRKTCNYIAFTEESNFYEIKKILSYTYQGLTVSGIIGRCFEGNGNAYRTPHMQRVVRFEELEFVMFERIISLGFFIPYTNELAVVSLSNVWETD